MTQNLIKLPYPCTPGIFPDHTVFQRVHMLAATISYHMKEAQKALVLPSAVSFSIITFNYILYDINLWHRINGKLVMSNSNHLN